MKKKLLRQMLNEWRSNVWIVVEFIIVSVVLWYICDYFHAKYSIANQPLGFDIENTYSLTIQELTDKSPEYIADRTEEEKTADLYEFLDRLRRRPEIEAAAFGQNSHPYNHSNSFMNAKYDSIWGNGLRRIVTPEFALVFRLEGIDGESPEQIAQELEDGKILLSDNFFTEYNKEAKRVRDIEKGTIAINTDSQFLATGTPLKMMRYGDYTPWGRFIIFSEKSAGPGTMQWMNELCIRVRPEMDHNIKESLMAEAQTQFHIGNYILNDVESFADIKQTFHQDDYDQQRNYYVGMGFLMLNIFLGLLGTFWFRTQQRVQEIALRKVNGATSRSVFSRLISEGIIMLVIATPVAFAGDALLAHYELNAWHNDYFVWSHIIINASIAFVLMAVMVIAGIYFPALRAMKIQPAEALKDE